MEFKFVAPFTGSTFSRSPRGLGFTWELSEHGGAESPYKVRVTAGTVGPDGPVRAVSSGKAAYVRDAKVEP